ncbi:MAG: serine/threonine protein kinase, partial [Myxococcales bacterium]|nr:serine/threonine protein kinase [Myxococcales bacterium]
MATVYLARAKGMAGFEREVAIKVCHPHLTGEDSFKRMFLDEARLAGRIRHPNVVSTYDVGEEGGQLYLVMDYIDGEPLSRLLRSARNANAAIPPAIALRVVVDALHGLHAAHELTDASGKSLELVHRDVSPQNLMVGVDGVVRLLDFGVSKAASHTTTTREGELKGKLSYMAPELLHGRTVGRFTDIYAMGVVLWETLTGRRLFRGESEGDVVMSILNAEIPRPSSERAEVSQGLDAVVAKALHRQPSLRYATAADFAEAIERCGASIATRQEVAAFVNDWASESIASRRRTLAKALDEKAIAEEAPRSADPPPPSSFRPRRRHVIIAAILMLAGSSLAALWIGGSGGEGSLPAGADIRGADGAL